MATMTKNPPRTSPVISTDPDAILRWPHVVELVGLSRTTIWELIRRGDFPRPMTLTTQLVGWRRRVVLDWIASRPTA